MAALTRGLCLVQSAVIYAVTAAQPALSGHLAEPTPCAGWDVEQLLCHVADSMDVLSEAVAVGSVGPRRRPDYFPTLEDPVMKLRDRACALLNACACAGPDDRLVVIGDRELPASLTALAGALEITVHGWDIAAACGSGQPVPPVLAAILLAAAPLLIPPASRPSLFAEPVPIPSRYGPGDQLVAFLGRQPRRPHAADAG